jgi:cbb3-type cytochrome oxidase subunit 3
MLENKYVFTALVSLAVVAIVFRAASRAQRS